MLRILFICILFFSNSFLEIEYFESKISNYLKKNNKEMYLIFGNKWLDFDCKTRDFLINNRDKFYR